MRYRYHLNFTATEPVMKIAKILMLVLFSSVSLTMAACSDDRKEQTNKDDHVWKQQTDTLKSAKEMSEKMQQSMDQMQQNIDENN